MLSTVRSLFRKSPTLKVNKLFGDAVVPCKAHLDIFADAAFDLFMFQPTSSDSTKCVNSISIGPGESRLVGTGIRVIIPDGFWLKFHERSGLAVSGIHVMGGVIDSGYTGELKVILYNSSPQSIIIPKSKAIAQFTLERVINTKIVLISSSDFEVEASRRDRGSNGFGSTNVKV